MNNIINILHLEDDSIDAQLISHTLLEEFPNCKITKVQSRTDFEIELRSRAYDLILSDFSLPGFDGLEAMHLAHKINHQIPYVFVSGHIGEDRAIEALKLGATDYVLKDHLNKLVPTINRVLKEQEEKQKRLEIEHALVMSEKKYKTLFENASDAIFLIRDMKFFDCNKKAEEMLHSSKEEIIGKSPFDYSPKFQPDGKKSILKGRQKIKETLGGNPQFFEWRHVRSDGQEFDLEINLSVSKIEEELIVQAIARDITERKEAEERIRFLASLSFENPNPVFRVNMNCEVIFSNPAGEKLLKELKCSIGQRVPDELCEYIYKSFKHGEKNYFEYSLNTRIISFTVAPIRGEEYINFYGTDITKLKKAEATINLLYMAIDQSPVSIIVTNTFGDIKYVNKRFSIITGYSKNEVMNKNPKMLKSGKTPESTYKDLWSTITKGKDWKGEFIDMKKNGELIIQSAVISPVINKQGRITAYLAVKEDITQRREMEQKLRESEEHFRTIFEISPVGIANIDKIGRFLRVNKAVENILGYTESELSEKTISDITYDKDVEQSFVFLHKLIQKPQQKISFEKRYVKKGGQLIWARLIVSGVYNEKNELLFTITMIEDITQRKEADIILKNSELNYRNLFEKNLASVYKTTLDGTILEANTAFVEMVKYTSVNEVLRTNAVKFYPSSEECKKVMDEIVTNKEIKSIEIPWIDKNGNKMWVIANANLIEDELTSSIYMLSTIFDITKKKEAEEELIKSEEKYRELVENIQDIIFSMDIDGIINYVSPAVEDILGYKSEEITGKNFNTILKDSPLIEAITRIEEFRKGDTEPFELNLPTKYGENKWLRISSSPIVSDNIIIGMRGIISDITEKKNAEKELIASKNRAEEMNKLKSNFLANMGHELRTPLIGILGGSDYLLNEMSDPDCKEMANIIHESGQRLLDTLNLLLDLSKIEADKMELILENIEINPIITEVSKSFSKYAEKKNLYMRLKLTDKATVLKSDIRMMRGILTNLLNNALKFTDHGGVTITSSVKKNNDSTGHLVIIEVTDTGIGIPQDKIEYIFEEFRQISEGFSRDYQGTGLGLTIAKKYVKLLNGKISVVSGIKVGSTFKLEFPVFDENLSSEILDDKINYQAVKIKHTDKIERRIICLEDDEISKRIIKSYLENNYSVFLAKSTADFLSELKRIKYDLILLDINLGTKLSGIDVLVVLRQMNKYKNIPVIAITAYAMKGDREQFLKEGFTDYLSKPFTKDELLFVIKSHFEK